MELEAKTLTKIEIVDKRRCKWILENFDKIQLRDDTEIGRNLIFDNVKTYLNKVIKSYDSSVHVNYRQKKCGRFFTNYGLQGMVREIRNTLCMDDCYDIDIVNSAPTILSQYFKKNNIECPKLDYYCENRKDIINEIIYESEYDIDAGDVKLSIIKFINGGKIDNSIIKKKFIISLKKEIDIIGKQLEIINPDGIIEEVRKDKKENYLGSAICRIYQRIESEIILYADMFFKKRGYEPMTLIFDGFLLRKDEAIDFNNDVIDELNAYILNKTGYDIKFIIKPMLDGYDIPKEEIEQYDDDIFYCGDPHSINEILKHLKNNIFKDRSTLKKEVTNLLNDLIYIFSDGIKREVAIKSNYSKDNPTGIYKLDKYTTFIGNYNKKNLKYINEKEKVATIKLIDLIEDIDQLHYNNFYIEPIHQFENNKNVKEYVNIFNPTIAKRFDSYNISDIQIILNHIRIVWANNDEHIYKYILSYLHDLVHLKHTQICMVLNGEMGCGKTIILEYMIKYIFGHWCGHQTQGLKSICSRFAGWIENKILILVEEPTTLQEMNFSEYTEKLKDFITTNRCEIEKKGIDKYTIDCFHNLVITCNHLKGIHVPNEKERRFFIIQCNEHFLNNFEYFDLLDKTLDNENNMNILFNYLYDYNDLLPLRPIPMTEAKEQMIKDSKPILEVFLFDEENHVDLIFEDEKDINLTILYEMFCEWYIKMGYNKNFIMRKTPNFDKGMSDFGKSTTTKVKNKNIRYFKFNEDTLNKIKNLGFNI